MDFNLLSFGKPLLITLREGFEAALIVGILYRYVAAKKEERAKNMIWIGVGLAFLLSLIFGVGLYALQASIPKEYGELLEGILMFVAVGFLLYMVLWMNHSGISKELKAAVDATDSSASPLWGIFAIAFTSVLREGLETALFLHSAAETTAFSYLGAVIGLVIACYIAYLLFARSEKIPMKEIFSWTSLLLILFAAWLLFVAFKPCGIYFFGEGNLPLWLHIVRSIAGISVAAYGYFLWNKQRA